MRVVVLGATGNVGSAVVSSLISDPDIDEIVGVARRKPSLRLSKVEWRSADIATSDLGPILEGADAVVHLAWLIQPSRDEAMLRSANVDGSRRVLEATAQAGVPTLVYASSVGAYSPGPKDRLVDESWPTDGIETSFYSRHKAEVERILDRFESERDVVRIVRLRPGLIFSAEAAVGIRRLFMGPLMPRASLATLLPVVPKLERLRFQAVHSHDVADAYRRAILGSARGAFNVAAEPVLDPDRLGRILEARAIEMPTAALRGAAAATWRLRLQPTPPGWLDMALSVPLMDSSRARAELGWEPRHSAEEALADLLAGLRSGVGHPTPPLDPASSGRFRSREFATGVGGAAF